MRLVDRYWLMLTAPVVVCLGVYGVLGARYHRQELLSEAETEVRETATLLGETVTALPADVEVAELHALAERLTHDTRVLGIGIYGPDGAWVGGSQVARAHQLDPHQRVVVAEGAHLTPVAALSEGDAHDAVEVDPVHPGHLRAADPGPVGAVDADA